MRKSDKAFTLTELLIALGVIAILCAILLPIIFNLMPNQNVIMAKRAFYTTQTVVADMINSEACYPDKTSAVSGKRIGFDDGYGYPNCDKWGGTSATSSTIATEGSTTTKFQTLFADKLGQPAGDTITTNDGMIWKFTNAAFATASTDGGSIKLTIDVNGSDAPNCGSVSSYGSIFDGGSDDTSCTTKSNLDRFQMVIYGTGRIEVVDNWAKDAIKVNKNITDEK